MPNTYTMTPDGRSAVRSGDLAVIPWDVTAGGPAEAGAYAWRIWQDDGSPAALPASPVVTPAPTVTGNQWAFALADLDLSSAWQVGKAKSKAKDQVRVDLIARDTPLLAADPLLIRVAANAGTADGTASGTPLIDVPTVFAHAQGMPT